MTKGKVKTAQVVFYFWCTDVTAPWHVVVKYASPLSVSEIVFAACDVYTTACRPTEHVQSVWSAGQLTLRFHRARLRWDLAITWRPELIAAILDNTAIKHATTCLRGVPEVALPTANCRKSLQLNLPVFVCFTWKDNTSVILWTIAINAYIDQRLWSISQSLYYCRFYFSTLRSNGCTDLICFFNPVKTTFEDALLLWGALYLFLMSLE